MADNRQDSFGFDTTLPKLTSRLLDAHDDILGDSPANISFQHAVLCQVGLPRSKQPDRTFQRTSGSASLLLEAGQLWDGKQWREQQLPYGTRPRLALIHVVSEAVRTRSKHIDVGNTTHQFLKQLGMDTSGRGYAVFKNQMTALAACRLTLGYAIGDMAATVDAKPFKRFEGWLHPTDQQAVMWPGEIELSDAFFDTLTRHAVPLDPRAIRALSHSSLALDTYTWLAHRLHRVSQPTGTRLSWGNLQGQFGQEVADVKNFKRLFKKALRQVLTVYPDARIEDVDGGLILRPSPPPIRKVRVLAC
jgi:hypothetical protein